MYENFLNFPLEKQTGLPSGSLLLMNALHSAHAQVWFYCFAILSIIIILFFKIYQQQMQQLRILKADVLLGRLNYWTSDKPGVMYYSHYYSEIQSDLTHYGRVTNWFRNSYLNLIKSSTPLYSSLLRYTIKRVVRLAVVDFLSLITLLCLSVIDGLPLVSGCLRWNTSTVVADFLDLITTICLVVIDGLLLVSGYLRRNVRVVITDFLGLVTDLCLVVIDYISFVTNLVNWFNRSHYSPFQRKIYPRRLESEDQREFRQLVGNQHCGFSTLVILIVLSPFWSFIRLFTAVIRYLIRVTVWCQFRRILVTVWCQFRRVLDLFPTSKKTVYTVFYINKYIYISYPKESHGHLYNYFTFLWLKFYPVKLSYDTPQPRWVWNALSSWYDRRLLQILWYGWYYPNNPNSFLTNLTLDLRGWYYYRFGMNLFWLFLPFWTLPPKSRWPHIYVNPFITYDNWLVELLLLLIPSIMVASLCIPATSLAYSGGEVHLEAATVKLTGHQWFWENNVTFPVSVDDYPYARVNELTRVTKGISLITSDQLASGAQGFKVWFTECLRRQYFLYFVCEERLLMHQQVYLTWITLSFDQVSLSLSDQYEILNNTTSTLSRQAQNVLNLQQQGLTNIATPVPAFAWSRLIVDSADVIHSLWVWDYGIKLDCIPGNTNQCYIFPKRFGVSLGSCAEYCGIGHIRMDMVLRAYSTQTIL